MAEKYMSYRYPNESFSGCDMTASIVYSWKEDNKTKYSSHILGELQTVSYSIHMEKRPVRSIGNVNAKDYVMGPRTIAGSLVFAVFNKHFAKKIMAENNNKFKSGQAFLVDELPPFDIVISLANEYGLRSRLVIYGVRLLNEGQVMSINDVFTENTYQFMATDVEYMNDELSYESRSNYSSFFKLKDDYNNRGNDTLPSASNKVNIHYFDPNNDKVENIKLNVATVDATRNNKNGKAIISLFPIQSEGTLKITDSKNKEINIPVNGSNSYSLVLAPDMYTVVYSKPNPESWRCNTKSFNIKEFVDIYATKKYAPIIELLTDTTIKAYSNEPTHTHLGVQRNDTANYYELKNRRATVTNLERDTTYYLFTCNGPETLSSPKIKVTTFNVFVKPFNDFRRMVESNILLLLYKDLTRYYNIIDEAEKIAINSSSFTSPTDCIVKLKQRYEADLKNLDKNDVNYTDKHAELTHNIYACGELIFLSNKVNNNILNIVNKDSEVKPPKKYQNEALDNVFQFNEDINEAEFYRMHKNIPQFADLVTSNMFDNVDGHSNSFLYVGRSGLNHYVQSVREGIRSAKVEFYSMTVREKEKMLNENKPVITDQDQSKINLIIKDELGKSISNELLNRAFMRKIKTIDNPKILDVQVDEIKEDYIKVSTVINNITSKDKPEYYYIAVATKEDIAKNDFIYKRKFLNSEHEIILKDIDYALVKDKSYSLWVEDKECNQISNVTTFKMSIEENINDREVFEYEMQSIIGDIKSRIQNLVPTIIYNMYISEIENNEEITKTNVVDKSIQFILYSGIGQSTIQSCLKAIKKYIGFIGDDTNIFNSVTYIDNNLTIDSSKSCNTVIMKFRENEYSYEVIPCIKGENIIKVDNLYDFYIVINMAQDLSFKSNPIYIDTLENTMEVL